MKMYRIILGDRSSWAKKLRIMKLTVILLLGSLVAMSATSYSQNTKLNVSSRNATLIDIFKNIEEQSEFYFYFNKEELKVKEKVSVELKDAPISDIMDQVLANSGLEYKIIDRYVVVKEKGSADPTISMQIVSRITGKVTDASGNTMPGVSVVVKGTTTGTTTDADGKYILGNVPDNSTLVFSFVGMKSKEVLIAGKTDINVVLEDETIGLEEVIAIGYGTVKKTDLTGAVGTVKGELISERQTTQLSQALQGATSGVMVTRSNNAPGATATIRIRGVTTIGDSNPLIIVDGVPVDNINDINPNDVQDMSVLKDAASASIYGSRAASGVILITTKRAKTGEVSLSYNAEYGVEKPTAQPD